MWLARKEIERCGADGMSIESSAVWVAVKPSNVPIPRQGWKLHVSLLPSQLDKYAPKIIRLLLKRRCHFKVVSTDQVLVKLNDGVSSPATVGKAFTIYPLPEVCVQVANEICDLLTGVAGPRVLSDRRVRSNAPVYYRYGPFLANWTLTANHSLKLALEGPDGQMFDGEAELTYRQPPWVVDPFNEKSGGEAVPLLLGGQYRVLEGVFESARGNVYRCLDGHIPVIVKQARAHVGASVGSDIDARSRLRNERRILLRLDGVAGVPRFLDHFAHGADEFLAMTDVGRQSLFDCTVFEGRFLIKPDVVATGPSWVSEGASFAGLCRQLCATLRNVHEHGVILRDITPRNVVLDEAGRASFIDFGISSYAGFCLPGATPGYAPKRQRESSADPTIYDDLYSLGLTLCFAASGLSPISGVMDEGDVATRVHEAMRRIFPSGRHPVLRAVLALLDRNDAARHALDQLADARPWPTRPCSGSASRRPVVAALDEAVERTRRTIVAEASELQPFARGWATGPDASFYSGTAGILYELLQHAEPDPSTRIAITHLVETTVAIGKSTVVGPGLYLGAAGTDVVLDLASRSGYCSPEEHELRPISMEPDGADLMYGAAGVGLGTVKMGDSSGSSFAAKLAHRLSKLDWYGVPVHLNGDGYGSVEVESRWGYAHGLAGVLEFYSAIAPEYPAALEDIGRLTSMIGDGVPVLLATASARQPLPLAVGWCRGLAGVASSVIRACETHGLSYDRELMISALRVSHGWTSRLVNLSQCCGAAGIGNALIDAALALDSTDLWAMGDDVATHILLRSTPTDDNGLVLFPGAQPSTLSWGLGAAGVLTFLRRLRDRGGPMPFTAPGR